MRYIIGIDLGTTNSCVSYVDTQIPAWPITQQRILQLHTAGYQESHATLPSFCYLPASNEWPSGSLQLPWKSSSDYVVGHFALSHGAKVPTRLVQSAKSWLCHTAARRRDKILPVEAADHAIRISPVEACARYLNHIKEAWNYTIARRPNRQPHGSLVRGPEGGEAFATPGRLSRRCRYRSLVRLCAA